MPHFSYDFDNYTHHIARQIYILARPMMHLGRTVSDLGKNKSDLEAPKSDIGRHKSAPPHPVDDTTGGKTNHEVKKWAPTEAISMKNATFALIKS